MATPLIVTALATGEIAPSLYGRVDVDKERIAASTQRNMYVNYRGGCNSRAGFGFVGFSKQTGRDYPPRLIPFQFSENEGLVLEFGDAYMRVISQGAYVTETPVAIGAATNANPCVITFGSSGATAATPNNAAVTFTYAPGDLITLAGGTALTPAVLQVTTSELVSLLVNVPGDGYAVNDTITLAGGTSAPNAVAKVTALQSVRASGFITFATNPADGDTVTLNAQVWTFKTTVTAANQTQIKGSLSETLAQLASDLNASAVAALIVATYSSDLNHLIVVYDTPGLGGNAYTLAASVATPSGGNLTGGSVTGVATVSINTAGIFTAVPGTGNMTQSATSGGGTGATFQSAVFAPHALSISNPGAYTATPANPASQASTTGVGVGATFTMTWGAVSTFANDDWVFISGCNGMTELNGNVYRLAGVTPTTAQLRDVYGNGVDSSAYGVYTGGGTVAKIYTLTTPYQEEDLSYLKFTQSADVMTICCVNQDTLTEYVPKNLSRSSDTSWAFSDVVQSSGVAAPASVTVTHNQSGTTYYGYQITSVSPEDGTESVASPIGRDSAALMSLDDVRQENISWSAVVGVSQYNIYKSQWSDIAVVPNGSLFGYIGSAYGTGFIDKNLTPDYSTTPPKHRNPFARGQVISITMTAGGSGYNTTTTTASITSGTGSGAVLLTVVQNGQIVAVIVDNPGSGYLSTDTISFGGAGTGAAGQLVVGAQSGTYPSVAGYFQQRRVFANSLNNPDTYWMSQPGSYLNFDVRVPTIDTDAITGTPWAVQVNGIQWMVQTPSGLLVMTGQSAWLLVGSGTFATNVQPISPGSQTANPQPATGIAATVPPIKVLYDILYVTAKGSFVYRLPYEGYAFSEPIDLTEFSTHLFVGYLIEQWAWCEQPYKLLWTVRSDGILLSQAYLKAEQIFGWSRHDTQGDFVSCCQITEPPVDALYVAVKRTINGNTSYMIERMNDRIWATVEQCWCVDSGLALAQPTPAGMLTASSAYGAGTITGVTGLVGGSDYSSATYATIIDEELDASGNPIGSGATASVTVVAGVITAINITAPGANYRRPKLVITDPESGAAGNASASATLTLSNAATFTCSSPSFAVGDVGKVIRVGGGVATITARNSSTNVTVQITTPISNIDPYSRLPKTADSGEWTMTRPVTTVSGLSHLAGATITGLADGKVITPRVVSAAGVVTLDVAASAVIIGLGFQAQVQTVPIEVGTPTVQGQRKKISGISVYVQDSRSVSLGQNQTDGSTLNPPQIAPDWINMRLQQHPGPAGDRMAA